MSEMISGNYGRLGVGGESEGKVTVSGTLGAAAALIALVLSLSSTASAAVWNLTTQGDFGQGTLADLDMDSSPGDLALAAPNRPCDTPFVRSDANPVLPAGDASSWRARGYAGGVSVLHRNGLFRMWFTALGPVGSHYVIGHASSSDGITWLVDPAPVLSGDGSGWDWNSVLSPSVVFDAASSQYRMWYTGSDGSTSYIGYATSLNGLDWTRFTGSPVLSFPAESPRVLFDQGTYKMWYQAGDVFYATSSNGTSWQTQNGGSPVLPTDWREISIEREGSVLKMAYRDYSSGAINVATSPDGVSWTASGQNPILEVGEGGAWDSNRVGGPFLMRVGPRHYLWYAGESGDGRWQIGLATAPCPGRGTFLSYAYDAGAENTTWIALFWNASVTTGGAVSAAVRTGDTALPDSSWSNWSAELTISGSPIPSPRSRYVQVQMTLQTEVEAATPVLHDVSVAYELAPTCVPGDTAENPTTAENPASGLVLWGPWLFWLVVGLIGGATVGYVLRGRSTATPSEAVPTPPAVSSPRPRPNGILPPADRLKLLEQRLAEGQVSESLYRELKARIEQETWEAPT